MHSLYINGFYRILKKKTLYEVQKVLRGNIGPENPSSKPITSWLEDYSSYSDKLKETGKPLYPYRRFLGPSSSAISGNKIQNVPQISGFCFQSTR